MKIYTRRGDRGETDLFGGGRVAKDDLRVEAYGAVDELNAFVGVCASATSHADLREILLAIQGRLFGLGGYLATPEPERRARSGVPEPTDGDVTEIERHIDTLGCRDRTVAAIRSARWLSRRLGPARGAHRVPPGRAPDRRTPPQQPAERGVAPHAESPVRPALRDGARREPPCGRPRRRVGGSAALTPGAESDARGEAAATSPRRSPRPGRTAERSSMKRSTFTASLPHRTASAASARAASRRRAKSRSASAASARAASRRRAKSRTPSERSVRPSSRTRRPRLYSGTGDRDAEFGSAENRRGARGRRTVRVGTWHRRRSPRRPADPSRSPIPGV